MNYQLLFAVAAVFLLLALFNPIFLENKVDGLYDRYSNYDQLESFIEKAREHSDFVEAEKLFENQMYDQAAEQFQRINNTQDNDLGLIYQALSLSEIDQYQKALDLLKIVYSNNNSLQQANAYWYAAMIALKIKDYKLAENYLTEYLNLDQVLLNKQSANQILKVLEKSNK